jgi:hypothetical protein
MKLYIAYLKSDGSVHVLDRVLKTSSVVLQSAIDHARICYDYGCRPSNGAFDGVCVVDETGRRLFEKNRSLEYLGLGEIKLDRAAA